MRPLLLIAIGAAVLAGCSGVDAGPHTAANEKARASIEAGGGDPADWEVDNACAAVGPCDVELSPAGRPAMVVARNSYRVKDSFPWLLGDDAIQATVARAQEHRCLQRFAGADPLAACLAGAK